jgi:hypothetical protein
MLNSIIADIGYRILPKLDNKCRKYRQKFIYVLPQMSDFDTDDSHKTHNSIINVCRHCTELYPNGTQTVKYTGYILFMSLHK